MIDLKKAIIQLINKWACEHKWNKVFERDVSDLGSTYTSITYCCEKCGKFKRWRSS